MNKSRAKYATEEAYQRSLEASRLAKRRRRGSCARCGGETRYNGRTTNGPSDLCSACSHLRQHEERSWTRELIIRAFRRFQAETGRHPRVSDKMGLCESQVLRFSGARIREFEQVEDLGLVLPPSQFVRREFGSWAAGLEAAGMPASSGGGGCHRKRFSGAAS